MRASGASELENFHNHIHLPMQVLQTIIMSGTTKERGALLSEIIIVLDKNERASNAAENSPFIP